MLHRCSYLSSHTTKLQILKLTIFKGHFISQSSFIHLCKNFEHPLHNTTLAALFSVFRLRHLHEQTPSELNALRKPHSARSHHYETLEQDHGRIEKRIYTTLLEKVCFSCYYWTQRQIIRTQEVIQSSSNYIKKTTKDLLRLPCSLRTLMPSCRFFRIKNT